MRPVVRLFVACQSDLDETLEFAHTIGDITFNVVPEASGRYPLTYPAGFWLYLFLTGCRGTYEFRFRQRYGVGPNTHLVWESDPFTIQFGADPLELYVIPFQVTDITFPVPAQYEFVLVCDGVELDPPFYLEAKV